MIHAILIINNHGKPRLTKFYDAFVCFFSFLFLCSTAPFSFLYSPFSFLLSPFSFLLSPFSFLLSPFSFLLSPSILLSFLLSPFSLLTSSLSPFLPISLPPPSSPPKKQDETKQQQILRETYQHISRRSDYQCNFLEVQIDGANGVWDKDIKLIYRFVFSSLYSFSSCSCCSFLCYCHCFAFVVIFWRFNKLMVFYLLFILLLFVVCCCVGRWCCYSYIICPFNFLLVLVIEPRQQKILIHTFTDTTPLCTLFLLLIPPKVSLESLILSRSPLFPFFPLALSFPSSPLSCFSPSLLLSFSPFFLFSFFPSLLCSHLWTHHTHTHSYFKYFYTSHILLLSYNTIIII